MKIKEKRKKSLSCRKKLLILQADFIQISLQMPERTGILADSTS